MTQNEVTAIGIAIFVGLAVLRRLFRMMRGAGRGSQADRIEQAAQRVLKDRQQKSGRSSVPLTQSNSLTLTQAQSQAQSQAKAQGAKSQSDGRASSQRQNAQNQPRKGETKSARGLTAKSTPAVIRRGAGLFSGAREPVIQRRR